MKSTAASKPGQPEKPEPIAIRKLDKIETTMNVGEPERQLNRVFRRRPRPFAGACRGELVRPRQLVREVTARNRTRRTRSAIAWTTSSGLSS